LPVIFAPLLAWEEGGSVADYAASAPQSFLSGRKGRKIREAIVAYLFLLPAFLIILIFGLWPVLHSLYVSLHKWNVKPKGSQCFPYWLAKLGLGSPGALEKTDCLGLDNYTALLGIQNVPAVVKMIAALIAGFVAYKLWRRTRRIEGRGKQVCQVGFGLLALATIGLLVWAVPGLVVSGEWTYLVSIGLALLAWLVWSGAGHAASTSRLVLRIVAACALLGGAASFFFVDFERMWKLGSQDLFKAIIRTVFYSAGTVPVQLAVSLVLAYVLFQDIKGKGLFRLIYFLPYIAPTVATSVVFKRIFSLRDTGLMNQFVGLFGIPPLKWLHEAKAINPLLVELINESFGTHWVWPDTSGPLGTILGGPSLALISIMIYNWWVYIGYDAVIYLAGLGNIPHDLYEAAAIDGAGKWTIFRRITFPLLSPTTFFLAIMATIGTFKAFNSIWVMYERASRDAVDTASILIFRTFRSDGQFGEAAAMAFILFGIILTLSQIQRRVGEKLVFYG
jgi:multiple sugar transport system permease protein